MWTDSHAHSVLRVASLAVLALLAGAEPSAAQESPPRGRVGGSLSPVLLVGPGGALSGGAILELHASHVFRNGFELGGWFEGHLYFYCQRQYGRYTPGPPCPSVDGYQWAQATGLLYRPRLVLGWSGRFGAVAAIFGFDGNSSTRNDEVSSADISTFPVGVLARGGRLDGTHVDFALEFSVFPPTYMPSSAWFRVTGPVTERFWLFGGMRWDLLAMQGRATFGLEFQLGEYRHLRSAEGVSPRPIPRSSAGPHAIQVAAGGRIGADVPPGPFLTIGYEYRY